jgi:hypothetical protein
LSLYSDKNHHGDQSCLRLSQPLLLQGVSFGLALAGGVLRLVLQWQLKTRWEMSLSIHQALAGALVVLAGLPSILQPFPFPIPLSLTLGLLLPDLLLRRT